MMSDRSPGSLAALARAALLLDLMAAGIRFPLGGVGDVVHLVFFFFQAEDGIRDYKVTGVQTCALPIYSTAGRDHLIRLALHGSDQTLLPPLPLARRGPSDAGWGSVPGDGPLSGRHDARDRKSVV